MAIGTSGSRDMCLPPDSVGTNGIGTCGVGTYGVGTCGIGTYVLEPLNLKDTFCICTWGKVGQ